MGSLDGSSDSGSIVPEKLPHGVVRIKPRKKYGLLTSVLFRVALGVLFLGIGAFAVAWSVKKSEDKENNNSGNPDVNVTELFNFNRTQECLLGGILTVERRLANPTTDAAEHNVTKYSAIWSQSSEFSAIYHKVSLLNSQEELYTHVVLRNCSIFATPTKCQVTFEVNYTSYLQKFGLNTLTKLRTEEIRINSPKAEEKVYANISLYRGEPPITANYSFNGEPGSNPKLAMTYEDVNSGALYSWQLYFPRTSINQASLYWVEYWYPEMKATISNPLIFTKAPSSCDGVPLVNECHQMSITSPM